MPFIAIAIRNSNLYAQSRKEAQTNKVLLELATIVFDESSTTVDNLVSRILYNSLFLLECEKCQVILLSNNLTSKSSNRRSLMVRQSLIARSLFGLCYNWLWLHYLIIKEYRSNDWSRLWTHVHWDVAECLHLAKYSNKHAQLLWIRHHQFCHSVRTSNQHIQCRNRTRVRAKAGKIGSKLVTFMILLVKTDEHWWDDQFLLLFYQKEKRPGKRNFSARFVY